MENLVSSMNNKPTPSQSSRIKAGSSLVTSGQGYFGSSSSLERKLPTPLKFALAPRDTVESKDVVGGKQIIRYANGDIYEGSFGVKSFFEGTLKFGDGSGDIAKGEWFVDSLIYECFDGTLVFGDGSGDIAKGEWRSGNGPKTFCGEFKFGDGSGGIAKGAWSSVNGEDSFNGTISYGYVNPIEVEMKWTKPIKVEWTKHGEYFVGKGESECKTCQFDGKWKSDLRWFIGTIGCKDGREFKNVTVDMSKFSPDEILSKLR